MFDELKTLELDIEKGTLKVNGQELHNISKFEVSFQHGEFKLVIESKYHADGLMCKYHEV